MILLLLACSPLGKVFAIEPIEPGSFGVFLELQTVVYVPEEASDEALVVTLRADPGRNSIDAIDRFAETRSLFPAGRVYRLEVQTALLTEAIWIGRWDDNAVLDGVGGTLFTAVQTDEGWSAEGHFDAPWIEVDPVLLHPDRAWFPTTSPVLVHSTAGTSAE